MAARIDSTILHDIVRVIEARAKVPERLKIKGKSYQITYLEDHKQRLEEAIRRHDSDRLNMLFGQMQSKVKYQLMRASASRTTAGRSPAKRTAAVRSKVSSGRAKPTKKAPKKVAKKTARTSARRGTTSRSRSTRRRAARS